MNILEPQSPPKLLDQVRELFYSCQALKYLHGKRHPGDMGKAEISAFLSHPAVRGKVASSTQKRALNGILFLYLRFLKQDVGR